MLTEIICGFRNVFQPVDTVADEISNQDCGDPTSTALLPFTVLFALLALLLS